MSSQKETIAKRHRSGDDVVLMVGLFIPNRIAMAEF